ncbi:uncharacterized protein LOC132195086 isoform X2 [Neocloeon triangulifer]|uniref:uncharacterized protein LOC132195086 isoform X2 n=1 Tax=Neocloeon triangulifer TaxID=2078957 RepID=UPI00286EE68E|nr:uncharacterized protein LOC132195086 isoform X2 [Neocloeon triangulifer]
MHKSCAKEYPDDLNPFGDAEQDGVETRFAGLNPFECAEERKPAEYRARSVYVVHSPTPSPRRISTQFPTPAPRRASDRVSICSSYLSRDSEPRPDFSSTTIDSKKCLSSMRSPRPSKKKRRAPSPPKFSPRINPAKDFIKEETTDVEIRKENCA